MTFTRISKIDAFNQLLCERQPIGADGYQLTPKFEFLEEYFEAAANEGLILSRDDLLKHYDDLKAQSQCGNAFASHLLHDLCKPCTLRLELRNLKIRHHKPNESAEGTKYNRCIVLEIKPLDSISRSAFRCGLIDRRWPLEDQVGMHSNYIVSETAKAVMDPISCSPLREISEICIELLEPLSTDDSIAVFRLLKQHGLQSIAMIKISVTYPTALNFDTEEFVIDFPFNDEPIMLTGKNLLSRIEELDDLPKRDIMIACGYYTLLKDGKKISDPDAFKMAKFAAEQGQL